MNLAYKTPTYFILNSSSQLSICTANAGNNQNNHCPVIPPIHQCQHYIFQSKHCSKMKKNTFMYLQSPKQAGWMWQKQNE